VAQGVAEAQAQAAATSANTAETAAGQASTIAEQLEPNTSSVGRNITIAADGTIETQIGHSYVVTAGAEKVSVTDTVHGGEPLVSIPAGKQLGFVAIAENYTLSDTACTVTEVFRCAASVELSGSGFPDGVYVCFKPDRTELFSYDVDGITSCTHLFYNIQMESFDGDLSALHTAPYMFYGTKLKTWDTPLPALKNASYMFAFSASLAQFNVSLDALVNGERMFRSCTGLKAWDRDLPNIVTVAEMFCGSGLVTFNGDFPKVTSFNDIFQSCGKLVSFEGDISNTQTMTDAFFACNQLRVCKVELPLLSDAFDTWGHTQLDKDSALSILNSVPAYTSGTHRLVIGIHKDLKTDAEILEAIEAAKGKGWQMTIQWNGVAGALTASAASTYRLRRGADAVYAKLDILQDGEKRLRWGHYVSDWEENGYTEFATLEEAREALGVPEELPEEE
jgi:hypothetical protein